MQNYELTPKETTVLKELLKGQSNKEISHGMGISINTVKTHLKSIYKKKGVKSRITLILSNHRD